MIQSDQMKKKKSRRRSTDPQWRSTRKKLRGNIHVSSYLPEDKNLIQWCLIHLIRDATKSSENPCPECINRHRRTTLAPSHRLGLRLRRCFLPFFNWSRTLVSDAVASRPSGRENLSEIKPSLTSLGSFVPLVSFSPLESRRGGWKTQFGRIQGLSRRLLVLNAVCVSLTLWVCIGSF